MNRTATPPIDGGPVELSIVIPAYNEAPAIEQMLQTVTGYLDVQTYVSELIVVDDGSTDATGSILTEYAKNRSSMRVLRNEPNRGKGGSVKRGILAARGKYVFFMDADLSVPIEELTGALEVLSKGECPILIGSRKIRGARIERRQPLLRQYLGHGFTWLARAMLSPSIVDFTCGFKGFRREDAKALFELQRCNDWAFDAEILYLARLMGKPVRQYPVRWWHHKDSRVCFPRDIYRTLASLIRIRSASKSALRGGPVPSAVLNQRQGCED